jgi:hypothetical protein
METPNELVVDQKQRIKCQSNKSIDKFTQSKYIPYSNICKPCKNKSEREGKKKRKMKRNTILIKCDKCCLEKLLKEIITRTEIYKKKHYKKNICQECFPAFEKDHCLTTQKKGLNYRIKKSLAWRLRLVTEKTDTTMNYIGCNIQYVREWIEYNFTEEMNWDNYETFWLIDHVIPICKFDLTVEDEKFKCWNWSNLMPVPLLKNNQKQSNNSFLAPPFEKVEKLEKFKEEGSTTKWFSSEFILNKELALMKEK